MSSPVLSAHPRGGRARTPLAAAGTVLIALLLSLLAPFGAAKAHAIDQNDDVDWYLNSGKSSYRSMIDEVRGSAESSVLYGNRAATTWTTVSTTTSGTSRQQVSNDERNNYFTVNISSSEHPPIRILLRAHDLYVQGYLVPGTNTYYHFSDATLSHWPGAGTATNAPRSVALPFGGSYASMTAYANQTVRSPRFSYTWMAYNQGILAAANSTGAQRAGALLFYVEAIAEGARFNAISDRIEAAITENNGYQFDHDDEGLIHNWQTLGNNLQNRLNNPHTRPTPNIGRYHFDTLQAIANILRLAIRVGTK
ncbi:ribosome-inactivating family protein [Streptomyces xylophagus]|uniref:ribosome-inactivating family protein n=1 Tax=Streptomyces xylophagus TaxID=285514 RepID=UPI0005B98F8F|nr:ribosome-inactivating family protein [Streptomyces xylophagus]